MFPDLEVALCRGCAMGAGSTLPLWSAVCSRSGLYMGYMGLSVIWEVTAVVSLLGRAGPGPVGCQALPSVEAACWQAGLVLVRLAGEPRAFQSWYRLAGGWDWVTADLASWPGAGGPETGANQLVGR